MKKLIRMFFKFLFYLSYPILITALIVVGTLYFVKARDFNQLSSTYDEARSALNQENENKQITIDDLRTEFTNLTNEVKSLRDENRLLEQQILDLKITGYGTITGKIFPFITSGSQSFRQYQRVCAELVSNTNLQFCRTVSAIDQEFSLSVPAGDYTVYAEVFPNPEANEAFAGYKAYYTEYIKCLQSTTNDTCDSSKSNPSIIEVTAGEIINGTNPVNWE